MLTVQLDERASHGQAGQLFQKQPPLPSAAEAQFAHQLLVSGFAAGRASNAGEKFPIRHNSRVQRVPFASYLASTGPMGRKWAFLNPQNVV